MGQYAATLRLNLGCGFDRLDGFVNIDAYDICDPDMVWDLEVIPYPWRDNSVDEIMAAHVMEHLQDWWPAFQECARILKPGGRLEIRVPHQSSDTAMTYRDHYHVFGRCSFHGVMGPTHGTSAWAKQREHKVPLVMDGYYRVPFARYNWMLRFPRLLEFCADHLRNFIWEQRFIFRKVQL